jgi:hypothetical protein
MLEHIGGDGKSRSARPASPEELHMYTLIHRQAQQIMDLENVVDEYEARLDGILSTALEVPGEAVSARKARVDAILAKLRDKP